MAENILAMSTRPQVVNTIGPENKVNCYNAWYCGRTDVSW